MRDYSKALATLRNGTGALGKLSWVHTVPRNFTTASTKHVADPYQKFKHTIVRTRTWCDSQETGMIHGERQMQQQASCLSSVAFIFSVGIAILGMKYVQSAAILQGSEFEPSIIWCVYCYYTDMLLHIQTAVAPSD
jgi:hypothetical protein